MVDTANVLTADACADGEPTLRLSGSMRLGIEGVRARARHTLTEGETAFASLSWAHELEGPESAGDAERMLDETSHFWRNWLSHGTFPDHPWRVQGGESQALIDSVEFVPNNPRYEPYMTSRNH